MQSFCKDNFAAFYKQNKDFIIILIVLLVYYIDRLSIFRLGINYEEGRDANAYLLALQGNLVYRDFHWFYGPFSFLVYPFVMKIFGINLLILRISYIIFASMVIPLTYFLAKRIMPDFWAALSAFLSVIFINVPYYTYNHIFTVLGEMMCLLMICRSMETDKKTTNLFWAEIFVSIIILTKPITSGISSFITVSLFILFFNELGSFKKRFKNCLIFTIPTFSLVLIYFLYFYSQTKLKDIAVAYPFFSWDSHLFFPQLHRVNLNPLSLFLERFIGILPINQIINIASITELKKTAVSSFNNFIFCLPFIVSGLIFFIYIVSRSNRLTPKIKEEFVQHKKFLLLFVLFSIFISFETLLITHRESKAYTIQIPFMLTVYILYLLKITYPNRAVITASLIALFLFSITYTHFFGYPYGLIKRYKKFTESLNIKRAKGILVTSEEKKLYESLTSYLLVSLGEKDRMAVLGCYPQISFLTERKNIFEDQEYIFLKFEDSLVASIKSPKMKSAADVLENRIVSILKRERPKIILVITDASTGESKFYSAKMKDYIQRNYALDKTFGPGDIYGLGGFIAWVNLYKLQEG